MKKGVKNIVRFSGWSFQLVVLVVACAWIGKQLDAYFKLSTPWFALILSLAAIFGSLYMLIRRILKNNG